MKAMLSVGPLLLCSLIAVCQTAPPSTAKTRTQVAATPALKKDAAKQQRSDAEVYGRKLLELAEADAGAIQTGTRPYVLLQIARVYQKENKPKAIELLKNALLSTRLVEKDDLRTRSNLQREILNTLVPLAPDQADELLTQGDVEVRAEVLKSLLGYYEGKKEMNRAVEAIYRIAAEQEVPYDAIARVMSALEKEQSGEVSQLFSTALSSYRDHDHSRGSVFFGGATVVDFPGLIVDRWKQLPPATVQEAIDEVLKQTRPRDNGQPQTPSFSITSPKGSLSFASRYEYELFRLVPILKELDPDRAEELLKQHQQVQAQIAANPGGIKPLFSSPAEPGQKEAGVPASAFSVRLEGPDPQLQARMQDMNRAFQISQDAQAHPQEALAQVPSIADLDARASALEGIARANARNNPTLAGTALKQLLELSSKLNDFSPVRVTNICADLYLKMGEPEAARSALQKGIAGAEKMHKEDSEGDDPNRAIEAYWPSTQAYAVLLRTATQISPGWALDFLEQMPDAEVRAVVEASLASGMLKGPGGFVTVVRAHKQSMRSSMWRID